MQAQHGIDAAPQQDTRPMQDQFDESLLAWLQSAAHDLVRLTQITHLLVFNVVLYVIFDRIDI